MDKKYVWILRASSLWVFYTWGVLVKNMIKDKSHSLGFRLVHIALAAISLGFGGAVWKVSNELASK
ncbi:hypothetical protein [Ferrithrix thermotolerans]|jgi:hypothetical protein|uniref:hypothetical protein n=1 Tax=Ferrithrix thermotolerans TaxID=209649 RepID=UPI000932EC24|nr:hypothetical protein [Ferrithrix thermotolerans]